MKLQRSVSTLILAIIILSGCVENVPCSEIWRYRGMPEYEALAKKCPEQAAAAESTRKGTFKKSEPREW
ncbi:hypothetical protein SAMN05216404_11537 [Nitrosospira multiformis]|uniref:Entry exclusion lipoprotein TrbK n=1 Tax=Nitrosospira multiformis TaxID=1231 RepID=A0A1H8N615_9PROT|nr:hypothetical protein [Nitrosospira multiformis]SEO25010.1 hypothetical protein SAMN05216404_11537 [Nitrosospira multiformis]